MNKFVIHVTSPAYSNCHCVILHALKPFHQVCRMYKLRLIIPCDRRRSSDVGALINSADLPCCNSGEK